MDLIEDYRLIKCLREGTPTGFKNGWWPGLDSRQSKGMISAWL